MPIDSTAFLALHGKGYSTFVETGSYQGTTIAKALSVFDEIHSIELSPDFFEQCQRRFAANPNVHLYLGDSAKHLAGILSRINEPCLIWLDAHFVEGGGGLGANPLLNEIATVMASPISHLVLIDDVRLFGSSDDTYIPSMATVKAAFQDSTRRYRFSLVTGHRQYPNDILIAWPEVREGVI